MSKKHKTLTELQANDCRWPIGDPREDGFHFCGAPQTGTSSYCEHHMRASFDDTKQRARVAGGARPSIFQVRRAA